MPRDGSALLTQDRLSACKAGQIIVNTARSKLIDESAMLDALDDGRVAAYATDVFDQEPPASLSLAAHPRVIATSHIGGFTAESVERATRIAADNLRVALRS